MIMRTTCALAVGVGIAVVFAMISPAMADYYDDFSDGYYARDPFDPRYDANDPNWTDPNNPVWWDADNPDWSIGTMVPGAPTLVEIVSDSVADKAVRLWADRHWLVPYGAVGITVESGDRDPNTSPTWWDDTTDHYILAWIYYTGYYNPHDPNPHRRASFNDPNYDPNYDDPNDDTGQVFLMMHVDDANWTAFIFHNAFCSYHDEWGNLPKTWAIRSIAYGRPDWPSGDIPFREIHVETNDPGWGLYPNVPWSGLQLWPVSPTNPYGGPNLGGQNIDNWERSGYWMLFQFDHDPNYPPGTEHGKYLRGAIWHGDKYDWDGKWLLEGDLSGLWKYEPDPNEMAYWPEGSAYLLVTSMSEEFGPLPAESAFDHIEVRTGKFSNDPRRLRLTIGHSNWGAVNVDPDLRDPNDPNRPDEKLFRYTKGTEVALTARPVSGKSFSGWTIYDPNYPGDLSHAATDANAVLYLTMNFNWQVDAAFKCGSGLPPFIAMALLALGIGIALRRLT
jgi:hypothetical protein